MRRHKRDHVRTMEGTVTKEVQERDVHRPEPSEGSKNLIDLLGLHLFTSPRYWLESDPSSSCTQSAMFVTEPYSWRPTGNARSVKRLTLREREYHNDEMSS